ncbi:MAG: hypothetical protein ABFD69_08080, partial [Candidatus Sumerlaeia bacterium]
VALMDHSHPMRQGIRSPRDGQQVNMIRHQAKTPDRQFRVVGPRRQIRQIKLPVAIAKENIAPLIATVSHMIRHPGQDNASHSNHNAGSLMI